MNKANLIAEVMQLPREERLQLVEELWNSVIDDEQWLPTPDQLAEARRRLEEHRRDPSSGIPAERVLARLKSRFG
ncbi:addiction module protein [Microbacteriaceae bacterium K1510]|nr:addiction module protein [Microbacteriaceae bacterium K1510]